MSDISKFVDKIRKIAQENDYPELTALVEKWDFEDRDCETCEFYKSDVGKIVNAINEMKF